MWVHLGLAGKCVFFFLDVANLGLAKKFMFPFFGEVVIVTQSVP